jgi:hypothetical protein
MALNKDGGPALGGIAPGTVKPHALSGRSRFAKGRNVRISGGLASGDSEPKKANEIKDPFAFMGLFLAGTEKCGMIFRCFYK